MIALVKIIRSNKQVIELFCLIVSLPLVFLNIELHLSDLYPKHSSVAAAINYRKVRQLSFEQQWEEGKGFGQQNVTEASEEVEDQFSSAYNKMMMANLKNRSRVVSDVCRYKNLSYNFRGIEMSLYNPIAGYQKKI